MTVLIVDASLCGQANAQGRARFAEGLRPAGAGVRFCAAGLSFGSWGGARRCEMTDYSRPPEETLRRYAKQLDELRERQRFARPSYDVFGDALFWPDEMPTGNPTDLILALRGLFYHRTGLIIGKTRGDAELWELGRELFPHWVGFHPSRRSPRLARIYQGYASCLQRELDEIFGEDED